MIPKKLYIPTTTLNFNNIMASESISPAGFYSVRNFGYKRFDKVKPNNLDKRIILYDKYPIYDIIDIELENYPIVIEVSPVHIGEDLICEYKNGIYYTEETIYLNPFTTKIYFRNDNEKRRTLSKVEQSLNTKMVSIYQNCIHIKTSDIISFEWRNNDLTDSTIDFSKHISKDRKINKLKGFMYAYLFGAIRSLSHEGVVLKKYAKELQNTLSAIITNPDKYANYKQKEDVENLYQRINDAFYQVEGIGEIFKSRIKQKEEQYNCSNFIDILKKEDLYLTWYEKQNLKPSCRISPFNLSIYYKSHSNKKDGEYNNSKAEENKKYFDTYFVDLENAIAKHIKLVNANINNLPSLQHCNRVEYISSDKTGFQAKLFNEYSEEQWNAEELLADRLGFATAGGKLFKEELQDNWENSLSKTYINDLRNNLASHSSFALNSVHNLTLQSFAGFCQKGEEDISKLEDYLISNEIGDFRIAFALWGVVFGFANMPKTLTNDLFLSNDLNYVSEVYKYIYKQVHDIELDGKLERKQENEFITISSRSNKEFSKETSVEKKIETSLKKSETEIEVRLRKRLGQAKIKEPKITDSQIDSVLNECKKNYYLINEKLFDYISKIDKLSKRTDAFKAIKEYLQPNLQEQIHHQNQTLVLEFQSDKKFYLDDNAWSYINDLLQSASQETKEKVKNNLIYIQKEYRSGSYYHGRKDSPNNKDVIDHFLKLCMSDKNKYNGLKQNEISSELRDKIRIKLETIYG